MFKDDKVKIGFLGGCLSSGWNTIPKSLIYHQILRKKIKDNLNLKPHYILEAYGRFSALYGFYDINVTRLEIVDKVEVMANKGVDCIFFQLRPYLYLNLCVPFDVCKNQFRINPLLTSKKIPFSPPLIKELGRVGKLRFPGLYRLGHFFNLPTLAEQTMAIIINDIYKICEQNNIKLFVIMPVFPSSYPPRNTLILAKFLSHFKFPEEISFIETQSQLGQRAYFERDNTHINKAGHGKLGEIVYSYFLEWSKAPHR
ncbi:MAG: hypothetical protein GC158_00595 [Cyanobacteria bacterium RI_101]|nr:hypothetical protein [Cyanobacteria bacterium RI_101]